MQKRLFIFGIIGIISATLLDGFLKRYAVLNLSNASSTPLVPFVDFTFHKNPGIIGDLPIPLWIVIPLTILILLFLIDRLSARFHTKSLEALALTSIIAGATNNLLDRILNGFTTDYLMFFSTSILNISDILIIGGALILLVYNTTNPHTQCNLIPSSPPKHQYGVFSCVFRSIVRFVRNTSHR